MNILKRPVSIDISDLICTHLIIIDENNYLGYEYEDYDESIMYVYKGSVTCYFNFWRMLNAIINISEQNECDEIIFVYSSLDKRIKKMLDRYGSICVSGENHDYDLTDGLNERSIK